LGLLATFGERWVMSSCCSEKPTAGVVNTYFRTDLPDAQVVIFTGVLSCPETEEFPDKKEAEYFYSVWTSGRI
jgi:hypothetical protein